MTKREILGRGRAARLPRGRAASVSRRLAWIRKQHGDSVAFVVSWFLSPEGGMGFWPWVHIAETASHLALSESAGGREQRYVDAWLQGVELGTRRDTVQEDPRGKYLPWLAKEWVRSDAAWARHAVRARDSQIDPHDAPDLTGEMAEWDWGNLWHQAPSVLDWAVATRPSIFDFTLSQAAVAAKAWHQGLMRQARRGRVEPGTTVHRWSDGWTLQNLPTKTHLDQEGVALGHCVGSAGYWPRVQAGQIRIWSLRDVKGHPHATLELGVAGDEVKTVLQVQGKGDKALALRHALRLLDVPALREAHDRSGVLLLAKEDGGRGARRGAGGAPRLAIRRGLALTETLESPEWARFLRLLREVEAEQVKVLLPVLASFENRRPTWRHRPPAAVRRIEVLAEPGCWGAALGFATPGFHVEVRGHTDGGRALILMFSVRLLYEYDEDLRTRRRCRGALTKLRQQHPELRVAVVDSVDSAKAVRGRGLGKAAYEVALVWAATQGAVLAPDVCRGGSTSPAAWRVWRSLQRRWPSEGDLVWHPSLGERAP